MEVLYSYLLQITWQQVVMWAVGGLLIYLAIAKQMEPSLLLPMGFGSILVNLPSSGAVTQEFSGQLVEGPLDVLFQAGIANELFLLLLFIGIGAMIDFGPLLSNPKLMIFGAAAQFGIFFTFGLAALLGFDIKDAASIAIIGAADGPTSIFVANHFGTKYLGAIIVAATMDCDLGTNLNMLDLNCGALMALCQLSVPYMNKGSRIINIASVAALQPVPYINVYAATKAFVLSFSRGLSRELRGRGITVTAVCPFWTKTEFFSRAIDRDEEQVVKKYAAMYTPQQIVQRAIRDAKRGRDFSCYGFVARTQGILAKLLPHGFVMSFWMRQQKLG